MNYILYCSGTNIRTVTCSALWKKKKKFILKMPFSQADGSQTISAGSTQFCHWWLNDEYSWSSFSTREYSKKHCFFFFFHSISLLHDWYLQMVCITFPHILILISCRVWLSFTFPLGYLATQPSPANVITLENSTSSLFNWSYFCIANQFTS